MCRGSQGKKTTKYLISIAGDLEKEISDQANVFPFFFAVRGIMVS